MSDNSTALELKRVLERLGAREFELVAFEMDAERGLAAIRYAQQKGVERPIPYALKLFDSPTWKPAGSAPRQSSNMAADVSCETCAGDRFVVVGSRPVAQSAWMERHKIKPKEGKHDVEYAPCPACNSATDTSFRRYDGSMARILDPAKVRELMER